MDRSKANFTGNVNSIAIHTGGLDYIGPVTGAVYNTALHTSLPGNPVLAASGGKSATDPVGTFPGVGTITQTSPKDFTFGYNLNGSTTAFAFGQIDFPAAIGGTVPQDLILGLNGPANATVLVEVYDTAGLKADFTLALTGADQNYTLSLAGDNIPAGFDRTKIDFINFVMDRSKANFTGNVNSIAIHTGGLDYVGPVTGDVFNAALITALPNSPVVSANGGKVDVADAFPGVGTIVSQGSPNDFQFQYNLNGGATNFAYATIDIPAAAGGTLPANFVIGVNGPANSKLKVKVVDTTGKVADFILSLTGSLQNYTLALSGDNIPAGFDLTKVDYIELNVDRALTNFTGNVNTLDIRVGGLDFLPVIGGTTFNQAALTVLNNAPALTVSGTNGVAGQPNAIASVQQDSSSDFLFEYDIRPSTSSFAYANLSNGGFNGSGVFVGTPANLPQDFVIAAMGHLNGLIKIIIVDVNGKQADFKIRLGNYIQNYTLTLAGNNIPAGFDRTQVAQILVVADANTVALQNDIVQLRIPGMSYSPAVFPSELQAVKDNLTQKGLTFFDTAAGLDPVTHFPYDSVEANGLPDASAKFTQPTSIGFYLQILADAANAKISNGKTMEQNMAEMDTVLTNLLSAQASFGWNGLLPWIDLNGAMQPYNTTISVGDNGNLGQSIAVMIGQLESTVMTPAQRAAADAIVAKAEQFLDNQAPGYQAFVDPTLGIFRLAFNRTTLTSTTGAFDSYIDRVGNEFRGAIAFIAARYHAVIPSTVFSNMTFETTNYTDRNGVVIENLAYYEGSAFQAFWPSLRNDERDFIGFRNALYNAVATFSDFSAVNNLPGFVSASQRPNGSAAGNYYGRIGIRDMAESGQLMADQFVQNVASTYALASAAGVDPQFVLNWLNSIEDTLPALLGNQGFFDSARSNTEIARRVLAIDVASTILGLTGAGPDAFNVYMKNRAIDWRFNNLYEAVSDSLTVDKTTAVFANPAELADRSFSLFSHFSSEGSINGFPSAATTFTGVDFAYGALAGGFGGQFWVMDADFNTQAGQMLINYHASDSPQSIKIELKDGGDNLLYATTVNMPASVTDRTVKIDLPNAVKMAVTRKVFIVIDQNATGDNSGSFRINSIDFIHLPSTQNFSENAALGAADVTVVPNNPPAQLVASNPAGNTLDRISTSLSRLNYDITGNNFSGVSVNFDPTNSGASADLSGLSKLVVGINSATVKNVKVEIDDASGNRAVLYIPNIDVTRSYYEFLASLLTSGIDLAHVKRVNFIVDQSSILSGGETGSLEIELGGLLV